jgi:hypothetical protein
VALRLAFAKRAFNCRWSRIGHCLYCLVTRGVVVVVQTGCGVGVGLVIWVHDVLVSGDVCLSSRICFCVDGFLVLGCVSGRLADSGWHSWHVQTSIKMSCAAGGCLGRHCVWIHRMHHSHWMRFGFPESPSPRRHIKHGG